MSRQACREDEIRELMQQPGWRWIEEYFAGRQIDIYRAFESANDLLALGRAQGRSDERDLFLAHLRKMREGK